MVWCVGLPRSLVPLEILSRVCKVRMAAKIFIRLVCLALLATPGISAFVSRVQPGSHVKLLGTPKKDHLITLTVALAYGNIEQLEEKLKEVSTPGSPDYGKYLDRDEVDDLFHPSPEAYGTVTEWLKSSGVKHISQQGANVNFATTVANANKLLDTEFAYYYVDGVKKLRTQRYSIPDEVADHIQLIHPTTYFGKTRSFMMPEELATQLKITATPFAAGMTTNCSVLITPDCFRKAYGVEGYTADPNSGSRVAFGSFLNQSARLDDLHLYQTTYGIPLSNFTAVTINGGQDHQDIDGSVGEANLDAQFQNAVSHPLPQVQYLTGGRPPFIPNLNVPDAEHNSNEPYLEYYEYLLNQTNAALPQVISNSYGDDEQTVPPDYAKRVCNLIGMMGLRGITVLESSGDTGTGAPCISNDGKNHAEFTPAFPGTCPCRCSALLL